MFDVLSDISWLSVLVAALAALVIAAVYFPVLIAKPYAVALGREGQPAPEGSPARNVGPVVCLVVTTITNAVLIEALDVTGAADALVFGLIVGVGYLTTMTFQIALNPNFPRPLLYGVINAPFFAITSVIGSLILVGMR